MPRAIASTWSHSVEWPLIVATGNPPPPDALDDASAASRLIRLSCSDDCRESSEVLQPPYTPFAPSSNTPRFFKVHRVIFNEFIENGPFQVKE